MTASERTAQEIVEYIMGDVAVRGATHTDEWGWRILAALLAEREACAHLAEAGEWDKTAAECSGECGDDVALAIRARGAR